jgi:hypothetical protein
MPLLARTRHGLESAIANGQVVWCGSELVSAEEHRRLVQDGANLTRFTYSLAELTPGLVERAVATVQEHCPGEEVVVEGDRAYTRGLEDDA